MEQWTKELTLAGYGIHSSVDFGERVRAAAAAGFTGLGLRAEDYRSALAQGWTDDGIAAHLAEHDLALTEVEYVTGWGSDTERDAAQREKESTVFHMARRFGVAHVNVGLLESFDEDTVARALRDLCDRAGELVVGVEFMPYSGIPDVPSALRAMDRSGRENTGLIVDAWHWARSGSTAASLEGLDPGRVVSVQLCDVLATPMEPMRTESLHHRVLPGQGHGDVAGMLRALDAHGIDPGLVSVEVISDELASHGPREAARAAHGAALAVLRETVHR
ncbi:sugar phosphate isomerase/epimerase [Nocardiopsis sp. HNM0947]|uniref:Sugar phosphate isomerase/epimerase n=1 Tax=Nocardiopsis coralli TaxID=2772213 RepID=A0ABR9P2V6_9ACTN|nr:sugar phosphate isomerase/epimerase [Nocardiopsis coralli]MBE2998191.1 sugar phosphate isomerase/epimerase [Nocardiopsis coralli]